MQIFDVIYKKENTLQCQFSDNFIHPRYFGTEFPIGQHLITAISYDKKYVKEHKRYITARTNAPFQVRLDFPMPLEKDGKTGKSGLYYKAADGSYKCVYGYEIRSYNVTNRTEIPVANFMGYTGEFAGYGDRSINGVEAPCGDAGTTFARSITATADKAQKGKFLVM